MTMTRQTKTEHTAKMAPGPHAGYTITRFASPTLIAAAYAERGHDYMTAAEYSERRMLRRASHNVDDVIERRARIRRQQRIMIERPIIGRHRRVQARRVTGLVRKISSESIRCVQRAG